MDQITNEMLSETPPCFRELLLITLNEILKKKYFAQEWHEFLMLLIPKNNKKKFRPITLASCLLKLMERMILASLIHFVEQREIIPPTQNGFRKFRSCTTSLASLVTEIHRARESSENICALFVDIKSAFDHVNPNILQDILLEIGIPISTRSFIFNLMTDRCLYFKINHELLGPYMKQFGAPQGSVTSPVIYDIYLIRLNQKISPRNEIVQFADDTVIFNKGKNIKESLTCLQNNASRMVEFFESIGLEIAPEKSQLIIFSKSNIKEHTKEIKVKNQIIYSQQTVKYLGLILDSKLNWGAQANHVIDKVIRMINVLKILRGTWWGVTLKFS